MLILENLFTDLSIFVNFPLSEIFWPMAELGVNFAYRQLGIYAAWLSLLWGGGWLGLVENVNWDELVFA